MWMLPVGHRVYIGISEPIDVLRWLLVLFGILETPSLVMQGERAALDWRRLMWWQQ
jgi:hypothetical protein